jgi:hypothetical protein
MTLTFWISTLLVSLGCGLASLAVSAVLGLPGAPRWSWGCVPGDSGPSITRTDGTGQMRPGSW